MSAPATIPDLDSAKIGVLVYRSGMGSYVVVVDWRDNVQCFRVANLHGPGQAARGRHVDWDAMPQEAKAYFSAQMAANVDGNGGA